MIRQEKTWKSTVPYDKIIKRAGCIMDLIAYLFFSAHF